MYCIVKVFNGPEKLLTYSLPPELAPTIRAGQIAQVPLQKRIEKGLILSVTPHVEHTPYTIKSVLALDPLPYDEHYHPWIEQVAAYYALEPWRLYQRIFLHSPKITSQRTTTRSTQHAELHAMRWNLTDGQQHIVTRLQPHIHNPSYHPALLHGVTGSGKTAVYQELLKQTCMAGKSALLLVPEVSLAMTVTQTLRATYGNSVMVHEYHYAVTPRQRKEFWLDVIMQRPTIIVGVRLPIFIPLANLGLIIIDEEHDATFQDNSHPRINIKEAALLRAQQYKIPILLGSATPSLTSWKRAKEQSWDFFQLLTRFSGAFPRILSAPLIVKKDDQLPDAFWIGTLLREKIKERLERHEQTVIFLNRRGLYKFVQCLDCTNIIGCSSCSVSLTLHNQHILRCHYCGFEEVAPVDCPSCGAHNNFLKKGVGTQRIVEILQTLFPTARIARADVDSKKDQQQWCTIMDTMQRGAIDILVGTQIITKGYHFPHVTLVGVVWAESNLSIPFYTATEHTLQQLLQVAGRAGRTIHTSEVIIQSFIKHPVFSFINESSYETFYEYELKQREQAGYPPFVRLSELEFRHSNEQQLELDTYAALEHIRAYCNYHGTCVHILGPAIPPVSRVKKVSLRKMYVKGASLALHIAIFHSLKQYLLKRSDSSSVFFTPNPLQ